MALRESHGYSAVRALSDLSQNGRHEGKLVKGVGAPSDVTSGQARRSHIGEMTSWENHEHSVVRTTSKQRNLLKPFQRDDVPGRLWAFNGANDIKQYGAMESYWRNGVMGKSWVFSAASSVKTARSSATKFRETTLQECREHPTVRATSKRTT